MFETQLVKEEVLFEVTFSRDPSARNKQKQYLKFIEEAIGITTVKHDITLCYDCYNEQAAGKRKHSIMIWNEPWISCYELVWTSDLAHSLECDAVQLTDHCFKLLEHAFFELNNRMDKHCVSCTRTLEQTRLRLLAAKWFEDECISHLILQHGLCPPLSIVLKVRQRYTEQQTAKWLNEKLQLKSL